jgi:DNA-directed RNA polymerase subunit M/transcription elongation factor TFIIS
MSSCPECGAEVTYSVEEARVLTGTCDSCHKVTTLLQGTVPLGTGVPSDAEAPEGGAPATAEGLECSECGSALTVEASADGSLEVRCAECETVARFVPEGAKSTSPDERPARREFRDRGDRPRGGAPNSRPCRQCGAPLTFTTDENGQLTGECSSCGNRFTLPPRRDNFSGGGSRGPPRYGGRSSGGYNRGGSGGGRGWSSGGSGYRGGGRSSDRRRDSGRDSDDEDRPRRRRPRAE